MVGPEINDPSSSGKLSLPRMSQLTAGPSSVAKQMSFVHVGASGTAVTVMVTLQQSTTDPVLVTQYSKPAGKAGKGKGGYFRTGVAFL